MTLFLDNDLLEGKRSSFNNHTSKTSDVASMHIELDDLLSTDENSRDNSLRKGVNNGFKKFISLLKLVNVV